MLISKEHNKASQKLRRGLAPKKCNSSKKITIAQNKPANLLNY